MLIFFKFFLSDIQKFVFFILDSCCLLSIRQRVSGFRKPREKYRGKTEKPKSRENVQLIIMITNVLLPLLLSALVIYLIIYLAVVMPEKLLRQKFESLGDMRGLKRSEVVARCGKYHSIRNICGGIVCVWMVPGFVISLVFDSSDKVVKVSSKSRSKRKVEELRPAMAD